MIKEILIGISLGILAFLAFMGVNIAPFLLLGGLVAAFYFIVEKKGLLKSSVIGEYGLRTEFTFEDIGGQATAKQELKEALEFIIQADKIREMGIRPLKGILLTGPPGTGKTLLAKAAATYTRSFFLAVSGSEFIEMYAGVGAQRVRSLFKSAREQAKRQGKNSAIIFIDEIEVLGGKRGSHTSHLEYDQTLNQLLVEMDGISNQDDIRLLVIGATNRMDMLDPALLRPGRFDRQVRVDLPDKAGRLEILRLHTKNKPLDDEVDLEQIARESFGFSGAHLESLANEAAVLALREGAKVITQHHLREAIDKVIMGEKLDRKPTQDELERVAVHEAGHAVVSEVVRANSVARVTISPRGGALGYVRRTPENDQYLYTRDFIEKQIMICLGGAVAEEVVLGERSTGSSNDFEEAVRLAKKIISAGLSPLGIICEENISSETMHQAIKDIIAQQEFQVKHLVERYRSSIIGIAKVLLDNESLPGEELRAYLYNSVSKAS